jgi:hypothetical protein
MKYYVCSYSNKKMEIYRIFDNLDEAYNGVIKCFKKKLRKVEIVPFPQINEGCIVYKSDGSYYGTIVSISDNIISITKNIENDSIPDPFIKDTFVRHVLTGKFLLVDGVDIHNCDEIQGLLCNIKSEVYDLGKRMDYLGAQQISFFTS